MKANHKIKKLKFRFVHGKKLVEETCYTVCWVVTSNMVSLRAYFLLAKSEIL